MPALLTRMRIGPTRRANSSPTHPHVGRGGTNSAETPPPPIWGGRGAGGVGGEKPQERYLLISDLKFSRILCVAFPLRPVRRGTSPVRRGRRTTCVHSVAVIRGRWPAGPEGEGRKDDP